MKPNSVTPEVIILIGLPASGKSTFREKFLIENPRYVAVSRDDFRFMLRNKGWEPSIETMVTQLVNQSIVNALHNNRSVVIDATHCTEKSINSYSFIKDMFPVKIRYQFIEVDLEVAVERDSQRERSVGREVIEKMYNDLQVFKESVRFKQITAPSQDAPMFEVVVQDTTLPKAVIFDIDGTLAKMKTGKGTRSPFQWSRVGEDDVVLAVRDVLNMHYTHGDCIILLSGRDSVCRGETEAWCKANGIRFDALFMRPQGSMEKDSIVKNRLFTEYVLPYYYTKVIFDDRNQVVQTWREMGLTCFQVAPGDF